MDLMPHAPTFMETPYILYSLSKDRTAQKFNARNLEDIFSAMEVFLRTCTTTDIHDPGTVRLKVYGAYDAKDPVAVLDRLIASAVDRFGEGEARPIAYHAGTGQPHGAFKYTWELGKDRLPEAVQFLYGSAPLPRSSFGPIELYVAYAFRLVDPGSRVELPHQHQRSELLAWFSRTHSCAPTMYFPFQEAGPAFWSWLDDLKPHLPFTLDEKYLRMARLNEQGRVRTFQKIARPSTA